MDANRACVLLADDDADSRARIANALRAAGYSVVAVEGEDEIMTRLASGFLAGKRHGGFDVVLCVGCSIAADGLDVLRHAHLSTPVVVVTERSSHVEQLVDAALAKLRERTSDEDDEREEPILDVVASYDSGIDAFALKANLEAHGVHAFLAAHAVARSRVQTDVLVLERDLPRARALLAS